MILIDREYRQSRVKKYYKFYINNLNANLRIIIELFVIIVAFFNYFFQFCKLKSISDL